MLKIEYQGQFKKDFKLAVISILVSEQPLPEKYRDHALTNSKEYINVRECHIQPDWLLIYKIYKDSLILKLIRTGSHSDLF